jgi:tetratricopeptide (TPR) repeat protein
MRILLMTVVSVVAASAQPAEFDALRNRGFELERAGKFQDAIEVFTRAVALNPNEPGIHEVLGGAYRHFYVPGDERAENLAMASRAESEFKRSLELRPNSSTSLDALMSLNYGQKKYKEAAEWEAKLLVANPRNKSAHQWAGALLGAELNPEIAKVRAAAGLKSGDPGPLPPSSDKTALVSTYSLRIEEAMKHLRRAIDLDPTYEAAMISMSRLIRARADLRDTSEEYRQDADLEEKWLQRAAEARKVNEAAPVQRIRVGGNVQMANLLRKPSPSCPPGIRVSDQVQLTVVIAKNGEVQDISVIRGDPGLAPLAVEAVSQWVYKPSTLNNVPVEVISQVDVNFNCGH